MDESSAAVVSRTGTRRTPTARPCTGAGRFGAGLAVGLAIALTACSAPTTTPPTPVQPRPASSVGQAHESEVAPGLDAPDDRPVPAFAELTGDERRALVRLPASEHGAAGACGPQDVAATLRFEDAAAGHRYGTITLSATADAPCRLRGYPGLGARGKWGHRFTPEVEQVPFGPGFQYGDETLVATDLSLAPGQDVIVRIEWTGALGGAQTEPLGDLVLQLQADQPPIRVAEADTRAADLGAFSTVRLSPFTRAP